MGRGETKHTGQSTFKQPQHTDAQYFTISLDQNLHSQTPPLSSPCSISLSHYLLFSVSRFNFHLSSILPLGSVFLLLPLYLSLPLPFTVSCKEKLPKKEKKKKKLLESDNCGSLRYIPIRKGDTCHCRGSRAEL